VTRMRPARWAALLLAIVLVLQVTGLDRYPAVWFDEGFRFNAARVLADEGAFGSRSAAGIIPFDAALTSGPLEVSLVAASFSALGLGVTQGRLPFVVLTLLALLLVYAIGVEAFAPTAAIFMVLTVAAAPPIGDLGVLRVGRQALSETPAMAMVLLGLWCWVRSWDRASAGWAWAAGLCFGVGLLSKSQFAIALVPAVALVAAGRYDWRLDTVSRAAAPMAGIMVVLAGWWALGRWSSDPAIADANLQLLQQGVAANIVTGLWGAALDRGAVLVAVICLFGVAWTLLGARFDWWARQWTAGFWLAVFLGLVALFNTIWFALFSIGWRRYAYIGYVATLMLAGLLLWRLLAWAERRLLAAGRPSMARVIAPAVASLLVLMMVTGAAAPLWRGDGSDNAAMMSRFIEAHVPRSAVIETWEWELSGLGRHTAFHFPDQRYVYLVTAQQGRQLAFDLPYDPLVADPDYLVTGPFSALTGLYRQEVVDRHFSPVAEYPPYVLYARQRDITATGR
jgi:4-amino-4-deoxy-L-arabinose transferase-like glycosyltransferase